MAQISRASLIDDNARAAVNNWNTVSFLEGRKFDVSIKPCLDGSFRGRNDSRVLKSYSCIITKSIR